MTKRNTSFAPHGVAIVLAWLISLTAQAATSPSEVIVSAAVSLKEAASEVARDFEKRNPNEKIIFNFGASGQLKMQIENGAPADAFISAAAADMDALEKKGVVETTTRFDVAKNSLVLIRNRDKSPTVNKAEDLLAPTITRIAIGNPSTVPAGRYAKESLEKRGIFDKLHKKFIMAENVRQVLDYVARGEVDAGFVYKTDARVEPKVTVCEVIPADQHKPITYPAAVLKGGKSAMGAKKFIDYLRTPAARAVLKKYGFE